MILWMSLVVVGLRSIGFVLGRRGQLSRRSSIQVDEISCIRDHPRSLLSELQVMRGRGSGHV